MLEGCSSFNQPTSSVTDMPDMFRGCSEFNQPVTSNVDNMEYMFCGCSKFNQPVGGWDCVTAIAGMAKGCPLLEKSVGWRHMRAWQPRGGW